MAIIKINNNAIDLDAAEIPNLDAAKITTGQFADAKIADVASSKITGTITPSDATVTAAKIADATITAAKIADGAVTGAKLASGVGGKVLQVVTATKTDTFTTTSTSYVDLTNLSLSITPSSSANKILILVNIHAVTTSLGYGQIVRDSTAIGIGESSGSRVRSTFGNFSEGNTNRCNGFTMSYLDSPSTTSATTYKLQVRHENGASTLYVNRTEADVDGAAGFRPISTITAMEIAE